MTDKEIIQALKRLKSTKDYLREKYQEDIKNCPYPDLKPLAKQTYEDNKKAFDIAIKTLEEFNRQQAEIERLQTVIFKKEDTMQIIVKRHSDELQNATAENERLQKAEVQYVKAYFDEFIERLKNDFLLAQLDSDLLNKIVDELAETMKNEFSTLADFTSLIKTEAVKEFAKFLIDRAEHGYIHILDLPDCLLEFERAGDSE